MRTFKLTSAEAKAHLSAERLRSEFEYNPISGVFTRIRKFHGLAELGPVGTRNGEGYVVVSCCGYQYLAHRLAWFYMTGDWPQLDIDHKDGVRSNNVFANLREADRGSNMRNTGLQSNNTSGFKGVSLYKPNGKWRARAYLNGRCHYLGYFATKEEADSAYTSFARANFGEFYKEQCNG